MTEEPRSTRWLPVSKRLAAMWMAAIALSVIAPFVHAQTTVGGTVLEATTRSPVEGVRVTVEGTTARCDDGQPWPLCRSRASQEPTPICA